MIDKGIVQGSAQQAKKVIVGKNIVYVHSNIEKVERDSEGEVVDDLYQYHEVQYTKDEYIQLVSEQARLNDEAIQELAEVVSSVVRGEG